MKQGYYSTHWIDTDGTPTGGVASGRGFAVSWQNGALGTGDERKEPNGAFVEDIIEVAKDRIEFYQSSGFACEENKIALEYLMSALGILNARTERREKEGTEGTHKGS